VILKRAKGAIKPKRRQLMSLLKKKKMTPVCSLMRGIFVRETICYPTKKKFKGIIITIIEKDNKATFILIMM
jgi:hypothetical protein